MLPPTMVIYVLREHDESDHSNGSKANDNPINLEGHIRQPESKDQAKDVNDGSRSIDHGNDFRKDNAEQSKKHASTGLTLR